VCESTLRQPLSKLLVLSHRKACEAAMHWRDFVLALNEGALSLTFGPSSAKMY